ncbi:phospholipase A2-like [Zophobas morio]|uniref:phospholipase A2-like n=1 Tax=Zophobas morio TaxID=2755281 RepID=UPI003082B503
MKTCRISSATLLIVCALAFLVHQYHCFEIRASEDWGEPEVPAEHSFRDTENDNNNPTSEQKEHGTLDFIGRDIVRGVSRTYKKIKEKIRKTFSSETKGLDCNKTLAGGSTQSFKTNIAAIYPGTKWCGDGNISKSFDDLGKHSKADSCCREHDICPENMDADSTKYGLMNTGLFTRSHCDCDKRFYECLKNADSFVANSIGYTYFTILGPQCFKQDYPVIDCLEERRGKCEEYLTDTDGEKIYQWFDSPVY